MAAAKSSLQPGELLWEFCAACIMENGDGLLLVQLPMPEIPEAPKSDGLPPRPEFPPPPFAGPLPVCWLFACGKYPPGEGRPSGPRPGLRLSTRAGGLHLCNVNRSWQYERLQFDRCFGDILGNGEMKTKLVNYKLV